MKQTSLIPCLSSLGLLLFIAAIFSLLTGSSDTSLYDLWSVITGDASPLNRSLILDLRLPRLLTAFACGAMLALAGVLMQVLLRNPLADPYVLGVSGGASFAALLAMLAGLEAALLAMSAFTGAIVSIALVFIFSRGSGSWTLSRLLLTGIVMASGWSALISFTLVVTPAERIHGMLFWLMGDLSYDRPLLHGYIILAIGIIGAMSASRKLNVMVWGDIQAGSLGIDVNKLRLQLFLLASLLTAGAVTLAGSVGFIGLIVPHLMRLACGSDHRLLIPASLLGGGLLLIVADTLSRTLFSPIQLPVGILTALLGIPVFLYLLRRQG